MCGIAFLGFNKVRIRKLEFESVRKFVDALITELESRGTDATGIAIVQGYESKAPSIVFKKPLRASRMVDRPRWSEALRLIDERTNFILLHTRAATIGSNKEYHNNHPIVSGNVVGVHNGTLENHEAIKKIMEIDTKGEVDSEVIFSLLDLTTRRSGVSEVAMKAALKMLDGAFTTASVSRMDRNLLMITKVGRPLDIAYFYDYGMVVGASDSKYIRKAISAVGEKKVGSKYIGTFPEGCGAIYDIRRSAKAEAFSIKEDTDKKRDSHLAGCIYDPTERTVSLELGDTKLGMADGRSRIILPRLPREE